MIVLGVDTAGPAGSVALVEGAHVLASFYLRQSPSFSPHLLRFIDLVCAQAGCPLAEVAGLAVSLGPGAFTGLRVGLATVQGLAMASGKPVVGCSAFEALVALVDSWEGLVCPVLEARRGEVYAAFYRRQGEMVCETMSGMVISPRDLCRLVTERTLFLGSGVSSYGALLKATLGDRAVCVGAGIEVALAVSVAGIAQTRLREAGPGTWPILQPLYIRAADARLPPYPVSGVGSSVAGDATPGL